MTVLIILVMVVQVVRRDPLARLTEALREHKVDCDVIIFTKCLKKPCFCFRLIQIDSARTFQVVHHGKEGSSVTLACGGNQQVWIYVITADNCELKTHLWKSRGA